MTTGMTTVFKVTVDKLERNQNGAVEVTFFTPVEQGVMFDEPGRRTALGHDITISVHAETAKRLQLGQAIYIRITTENLGP